MPWRRKSSVQDPGRLDFDPKQVFLLKRKNRGKFHFSTITTTKKGFDKKKLLIVSWRKTTNTLTREKKEKWFSISWASALRFPTLSEIVFLNFFPFGAASWKFLDLSQFYHLTLEKLASKWTCFSSDKLKFSKFSLFSISWLRRTIFIKIPWLAPRHHKISPI